MTIESMTLGLLFSIVVAGCSIPGGFVVSETPAPFTEEGQFGADGVDCPWIQRRSGERSYLILPSGFEVALQPTRLIRDGAVVATAGELITVIGRRPSGGATLCASSPPLPVDDVTVLNGAGSSP